MVNMDIKDFKYGWRFAEEKYSLFSNEELSKIKIINQHKIREFWDKYCDNEKLERCSFIKKIIEHKMKVLIDDCGWGDSEKECL